jgi:hypothetical protein
MYHDLYPDFSLDASDHESDSVKDLRTLALSESWDAAERLHAGFWYVEVSVAEPAGSDRASLSGHSGVAEPLDICQALHISRASTCLLN